MRNAFLALLLLCSAGSVVAAQVGKGRNERDSRSLKTSSEIAKDKQRIMQAPGPGAVRARSESQEQIGRTVPSGLSGSAVTKAAESIAAAVSPADIEYLSGNPSRLSSAIFDFLWTGYVRGALPQAERDRSWRLDVHGHPIYRQECSDENPSRECLGDEALAQTNCIIHQMAVDPFSVADVETLSETYEAAAQGFREGRPLDTTNRLPDWACPKSPAHSRVESQVRDLAEECIRRTLRQVDTAFRRAFEAQFGWSYIGSYAFSCAGE
jgi:hypothetical protein